MVQVVSQWQFDALEAGAPARAPTACHEGSGSCMSALPATALPAGGDNTTEAIDLLPPGTPQVWGGGENTPPPDRVTRPS